MRPRRTLDQLIASSNVTLKTVAERAATVRLPAGAPRPPDWLDADALREWNRVCGILARAHVLTDADMATLAIYCESVSAMRKLAGMVEKQAERVEAAVDTEERRAAVVMLQRLRAMMSTEKTNAMRSARELGLTPASRLSVQKAIDPSVIDSRIDDRWEGYDVKPIVS